MADCSGESADELKYKSDVKYKNLYPVLRKEWQNAWNWNALVDLRRTDIKQQKKNVNRLTLFSNISTIQDVLKKQNECVCMV